MPPRSAAAKPGSIAHPRRRSFPRSRNRATPPTEKTATNRYTTFVNAAKAASKMKGRLHRNVAGAPIRGGRAGPSKAVLHPAASQP